MQSDGGIHETDVVASGGRRDDFGFVRVYALCTRHRGGAADPRRARHARRTRRFVGRDPRRVVSSRADDDRWRGKDRRTTCHNPDGRRARVSSARYHSQTVCRLCGLDLAERVGRGIHLSTNPDPGGEYRTGNRRSRVARPFFAIGGCATCGAAYGSSSDRHHAACVARSGLRIRHAGNVRSGSFLCYSMGSRPGFVARPGHRRAFGAESHCRENAGSAACPVVMTTGNQRQEAPGSPFCAVERPREVERSI
jgi:hypothetical protein